MKKTCFVISPIGKEGSDIRTDADGFLEYLIEPALEKYQFEVVRADKIPRPTVITSDIIRLVQEADLCIIDITNHNPNVFYECGRRHETGRPFIQMMKAGSTESIPFDVAGIRTVVYDLSTTGKARASVIELQSFIDELVRSGFGDRAAGHTMASIGEAIDRVERKLTRLSESSPQGATHANSQQVGIELLISHPVKVFHTLLESGNIAGAFAIMNKVRSVAGYEQFAAGLAVLASAGYELAFEAINDELRQVITGNNPDPETVRTFGHALKTYYINSGKAKDGVLALEDLYNKIRDNGKFDAELQANSANLVGMVAWAAEDHTTGMKYEELAVSLNPREASYWFNKGLTEEKVGDEKRLGESLRALAKIKNLDSDHIKFLKRNGVEVK